MITNLIAKSPNSKAERQKKALHKAVKATIAPNKLRWTKLLRSVPQFSQLINAALFCAAIIRSIKGRCKTGIEKPGTPPLAYRSIYP